MVTLDENDLTEEENVQSKIDSLRSSLAQGTIPEDLKEFINTLQEVRREEANNPELLDDDVVSEIDEEEDDDDDEFDDSIDDTSSNLSDDIVEDVNGDVDDLNELF